MSTVRQAHLRTEVPRDQIVRYTWNERLAHWLTAGTYVYCMGTGLALFTPYLYWIAYVLGGGPTVRFWHPLVGILYVAANFWMHNMWADDLKITPEDKAWNDKVKFYITNQDDKLPPQGRFDSGQKIFYLLMFAGAIALPLSGIVMWFPELMPRSLHWVLPLVVLVHEAAALLTIGGLIIHVYMGLFAVPGSLKAITVGYVSRGWAMLHHPLWYEKVSKEQDGR